MSGSAPDSASAFVREERSAKRAGEQQDVTVGHDHGLLTEQQFTLTAIAVLRFRALHWNALDHHTLQAALAPSVTIRRALRSQMTTDPRSPSEESQADVLALHAPSPSSRDTPTSRTLMSHAEKEVIAS